MAGINLNSTTLTEGPDARDEFITNVHKTSGLLKLVPVERITSRGQSFPVIPKTNVEEVGETDLKPITNEPITSLVAKPITLATTVPVSKQLINSHAGILNAVSAQGASDIADAYDAKAAGTVSVTGSNFGQLSNVTTTFTLETEADWFAALAAVAASDSNPSGVFLSQAMWAKLAGARYATGGASVFEINGDINSGTIKGIPYATFKGSEQVAYLGDFTGKAKAATVYEIDVDINPLGMMGEGASAINLWSRNMIGVRVEGEFAFNFIPSAFVKLVPAGS